MNYDKVVIQGKDYSLNNLHELPEDLNAFKVSSKSSDDTVGFFGEINPLSNFHPAKFIVDGQTYISSEQYIQATKASYFDDFDSYQRIMGCKTSFDCKQLAWSIQNVDNKKWDSVARSLCGKGIREKFVQNPHLMHVLLEKTANKTIVECANDRLWGNGKVLSEESCLNRDMWITQGILGQILEDIHNEFTSLRPPAISSFGNIHPPNHLVHSTYGPTPLHTMSMHPNSFRPTQIPHTLANHLTTQPQFSQTANNPIQLSAPAPVADPASIASANLVVHSPNVNTASETPSVANPTIPASTIASVSVDPVEPTMTSNTKQPSSDDMDTEASNLDKAPANAT